MHVSPSMDIIQVNQHVPDVCDDHLNCNIQSSSVIFDAKPYKNINFCHAATDVVNCQLQPF